MVWFLFFLIAASVLMICLARIGEKKAVTLEGFDFESAKSRETGALDNMVRH